MSAADDDVLYGSIGQHAVPQLLYVAARLGLADHLRAGPLDLGTLAARSGAHAPTLERALRALASLGVFARGRDGRYRMTSSAEPLLKDHPRSRRAAILIAGEAQHRAWGAILHSLTTGRAAFDHVHGMSFNAHLAADPEVMAAAEAARARRMAGRNLAIAEVLPLAWARSLVDVGGGNGDLLRTLLGRHAHLRGVLCEVPHVAARAVVGELGARMTIVAGDARVALPGGHDAYVLAEVVHWLDDDDATAVLARCAGKRVYVIERVLPPAGRASADHLADMHMLVMFGGRERTRREYSALFDAAGLRLARVVPTTSWVSILEARPRIVSPPSRHGDDGDA